MPDDIFKIPPRGSLTPNGRDDSLIYYYHPIVGPLYRARTRQSLKLLEGPYPSVLEIGYGSGIVLPSLARVGSDLHGLDIESNPQKTENELKKLGVTARLVQGDVHHMDYPDGKFDLVAAISIIQYFDRPLPVVEEIFRILKPGGHFLVGMPRVDSLMDNFLKSIGFDRAGVLHHTGHKKFLNAVTPKFKLLKIRRLPSFLPEFCGLYFSMLLQKPVVSPEAN